VGKTRNLIGKPKKVGKTCKIKIISAFFLVDKIIHFVDVFGGL